MIKIKYNLNEIKKALLEAQKISEEKAKKLALDSLVVETPVDTGNARDSWSLKGNKIVNTAEYIQFLNQGSSKQAPAYFVEATLLKKGFKPNGTIVSYK